MIRIQVLLTPQEREAFRRLAEREGLSLSAWVRQAALERMRTAETPARMRTVEELRSFFAECDRLETGREPNWEQHERVIEESRARGESGT